MGPPEHTVPLYLTTLPIMLELLGRIISPIFSFLSAYHGARNRENNSVNVELSLSAEVSRQPEHPHSCLTSWMDHL